MSQEPQTESGPGQLGLREIGADAVGYWERRRLIYNGILILIVGWYFVAGLPSSREHAGFNLFLVLLVLGVVANVLYCVTKACQFLRAASNLPCCKSTVAPEKPPAIVVI